MQIMNEYEYEQFVIELDFIKEDMLRPKTSSKDLKILIALKDDIEEAIFNYEAKR